MSKNYTSKKALDLIKMSEGLYTKAYLCPAGIPTIGYGNTSSVTMNDVRSGKRITVQEAESLLLRDLNKFEDDVRKLVKIDLDNDQFGALVSFAFNLGSGALKSSTLLKRINAKASAEDIRKSWLQWDKARNSKGVLVSLKGLTIRRQNEADLFLKTYKP